MSWGHAFVPLEAQAKEYGCAYCRGPWATKPRALYGLYYRYVTGRAGRHSWAVRGLCLEHAEKAAAKYKLTLPEEP